MDAVEVYRVDNVREDLVQEAKCTYVSDPLML